MRTDTHNAEVLIAPGEIRELLARLTEQAVEAVPVHEARTLEGLAIDTGIPLARLRQTLDEMRGRKALSIPPAAWIAFVVLACFAGWMARPTTTAVPVTTPAVIQEPKVRPNLEGTVPLSMVTYGPDSAPYLVDASFEPTNPLPEGLSVTANTGGLLWGSGDHRAKVIGRQLSPSEAESVRLNVIELLNYARSQAERRNLAVDQRLGGSGSLSTEGRPIEIFAYMYYGMAHERIVLPTPGNPAQEKAAERLLQRTAKKVVDGIQESLRRWAEMQRERGP